MKHFLITYRGRICVDVDAYDTAEAAQAALDRILDEVIAGTSRGIAAHVISTTRDDPGVKIGDALPADLSDEMSFRGSGDGEN